MNNIKCAAIFLIFLSVFSFGARAFAQVTNTITITPKDVADQKTITPKDVADQKEIEIKNSLIFQIPEGERIDPADIAPEVTLQEVADLINILDSKIDSLLGLTIAPPDPILPL